MYLDNGIFCFELKIFASKHDTIYNTKRQIMDIILLIMDNLPFVYCYMLFYICDIERQDRNEAMNG